MGQLTNDECPIKWSYVLEDYYKDTGEKFMCYSALHKRSESYFGYLRTLVDIPAIILATLSGSVSLTSSSDIFGSFSSSIPIVVGVSSISVGILNSVGSYFAWGKRCEAHKIASKDFDRLSRFIRAQLTLPSEERMVPKDFYVRILSETDRIFESSPFIPYKIVKIKNKEWGLNGNAKYNSNINNFHICPPDFVTKYKGDKVPIQVNRHYSHMCNCNNRVCHKNNFSNIKNYVLNNNDIEMNNIDGNTEKSSINQNYDADNDNGDVYDIPDAFDDKK